MARQRKSDCPIVPLLTAKWTEVSGLVSSVAQRVINIPCLIYIMGAGVSLCVWVSPHVPLCKLRVTHSPFLLLRIDPRLHNAASVTENELLSSRSMSQPASWLNRSFRQSCQAAVTHLSPGGRGTGPVGVHVHLSNAGNFVRQALLHYTGNDIIPAEWTLLTHRLYWREVWLEMTLVWEISIINSIDSKKVHRVHKCVGKYSFCCWKAL